MKFVAPTYGSQGRFGGKTWPKACKSSPTYHWRVSSRKDHHQV